MHHKSKPPRRLVPDLTRPLVHPNGSGHRLTVCSAARARTHSLSSLLAAKLSSGAALPRSVPGELAAPPPCRTIAIRQRTLDGRRAAHSRLCPHCHNCAELPIACAAVASGQGFDRHQVCGASATRRRICNFLLLHLNLALLLGKEEEEVSCALSCPLFSV